MTKFKFISVIAIVLLLQSCADTVVEVKKELGFLTLSFDTISVIEVGDSFGPLSVNSQGMSSNNHYLFDPSTGAFGVLNVSNLNFTRIGDIKGDFINRSFSVSEIDSLVYFQKGHILYWTDFSNTFKDSLNLSEPFNNGVPTFQSEEFKPIIKGEQVYSEYFPYINGTYKDSSFFQEPVECLINLNGDSGEIIPVSYPLSYQNGSVGLNYLPRRAQFSENQFLYSYPYDDTIYLRNIETGVVEKKFCGSLDDGVKTFSYVPFHMIKELNDEVFIHLLLNSNYYALDHLPRSGYILRFMAYPKEELKKSKGFKVVFYSSDFEYIGESEKLKSFGTPIHRDGALTVYTIKENKLTLREVQWEK